MLNHQKTRGGISEGYSDVVDASETTMTLPTTPADPQEETDAPPACPPIFHNFLRVFYPFHPDYVTTDSTVTLPLSEGDVVLVHSIHPNGWADGTLLANGTRGWLPTNYCEAYDPEEMTCLLKALLNVWDLMRSTSVEDSEMFGNQEFMKGIMTGVRYLLVGCLRVSKKRTPKLCDLTCCAEADSVSGEGGPAAAELRGASAGPEVVAVGAVVLGEDGQATPRCPKVDRRRGCQ